MEPMNLRIGEKLKSIRVARTLSLDDTAALTGVSKPMLGQIERGQSVPHSDDPLENRHGVENTVVRFPGGTTDGIFHYWSG